MLIHVPGRAPTLSKVESLKAGWTAELCHGCRRVRIFHVLTVSRNHRLFGAVSVASDHLGWDLRCDSCSLRRGVVHATIDNFATGDCPPLDQLVASARPTLFDDAVQMERENATLSLGAASDALVTNAAAGVLYAAVRDAEQEAIEEGMTGRAIACAVAVAAIWILLLIRLLSHAVFTPWLEISFAICSTIVLWGFALRGQRAVFSQSQISRIASQLAEWGIGDDGVDGAMTRMRRDPFGKASWIDVPRLKRQLRGELTARAARKPTYPSA